MNDDYDYEEISNEKSLLKDMAKKGISKTIKAMPLKTKLIIFGVIFGIVFFLLIFIVLISPLIMFFFNDGGTTANGSNLTYIEGNAEDNYWWPIGGADIEKVDGVEYATGDPTTGIITSYFGYRTLAGNTEFHSGVDISGGTTNHIIAINSGVVYQVGTGCANNEGLSSRCNGGWGNYVAIEHPGSVYSLYAHLAPSSITVSVGDSVKQGQVIGTMGNTGRSTGMHLHFQIEVGARNSDNAVNPLDYVSYDEPRPVTIQSGTSEITGDNKMLAMLQSWEGTGPTSGGSYIVYDDGYGYLTVGHGIVLKYNANKFSARGININNLSKGSKVEKSIVDSIELEIIEEKRNSVLSLLANNGISLEDYQVDALVIRMYNVGNVNAFPGHYKNYGNTDALYDNFMSRPVTANDIYSLGLARRRQAEWNLFHNGIYTFNG